MPSYWVGKLILGFVGGKCTLYKPFRQVTTDNESGSVIKVIKQYTLPSVPTGFCINKDLLVQLWSGSFVRSLYEYGNDLSH